jgi:hypothetical protein
LGNNKAAYTYAVNLFRQLGYIYLSKSSNMPCTCTLTESQKDTEK